MTEKRAFKKTSIKDVARRAAVSVTTVSHIVSQTPGYSAETIKRVKDAIEELNYVPSYAANGLRQRSTKTIGVCATDPFITTGRNVGSFPDRLWAGILEEADLHRFKVLHFPHSIRESEDAGEFLNGQIDGLIICAHRYDRRPATAARAGLPVVLVARTFDIPDGVHTVAVNEKEIIASGLEHLYELGHRRIAYIAGPAFEMEPTDIQALSYDDVARARLIAYQDWMESRVPDFAPRWTLTPNWDRIDLTEAVGNWMAEDAPTAIFACSDVMAGEALRAAQALGIDVPSQLSVLGIDNERESAFLTPSLSSIEVPVQPLGRFAVHTLLSVQRGDPSPAPFAIPDPEVFQRASTGPCRNS
ncbi:substrate-binding domain-containing protein [soil metagenome]